MEYISLIYSTVRGSLGAKLVKTCASPPYVNWCLLVFLLACIRVQMHAHARAGAGALLVLALVLALALVSLALVIATGTCAGRARNF